MLSFSSEHFEEVIRGMNKEFNKSPRNQEIAEGKKELRKLKKQGIVEYPKDLSPVELQEIRQERKTSLEGVTIYRRDKSIFPRDESQCV